MPVRGLVLDFDGLVIDSEQTSLRAWQELYAAHGGELPLAQWLTLIGTSDGLFDVRGELERQAGRALAWERLEPQLRARERELADELPLLPGVAALLDNARAIGLALGVASSSSRRWVEGHLGRLGIRDRFGAVLTRDDVVRTKPDPALYLAALEALGLAAADALAFEDSPNGVLAARAARMRVVAVPGALVRDLAFAPADAMLPSLDAMPLRELLEHLG